MMSFLSQICITPVFLNNLTNRYNQYKADRKFLKKEKILKFSIHSFQKIKQHHSPRSMDYFKAQCRKASTDKGLIQFKSFHDWIPWAVCQAHWTDSATSTWTSLNTDTSCLSRVFVLPPNVSVHSDKWPITPSVTVRSQNTQFWLSKQLIQPVLSQEYEKVEWDAWPQSLDRGTRRPRNHYSNNSNSRFV